MTDIKNTETTTEANPLVAQDSTEGTKAHQERIEAYKLLSKSVPHGGALVGRVKDAIKNPEGRYGISCTTFAVEDSMEGEDGIEASWLYTSKGLRWSAGVALDLSQLRPSGVSNGRGLTASGPATFATIYSQLNEVLRRGGTYKNGALTIFIEYNHPDCEAFLNLTGDELRWAKRAVYVDQGIIDHPLRHLLLEKVAAGTVWLAKKQWDENGERLYSNVCFSHDTLVMTREGHFPIRDLVGKTVEVWDGERWFKTDSFTQTSPMEELVEVKLYDGRTMKATPNHQFILVDGTRKRAGLLEEGDVLAECPVAIDGVKNEPSAYLKGFLIGDGTTQRDYASLTLWFTKYQCADRLLASAAETEPNGSTLHSLRELGFANDNGQNKRMQGLASRRSLAPWGLAYKQQLPRTIFNWSTNSKVEFLAGLMDSDGCAHVKESGRVTYSITSNSLPLCLDVQTLLKTLGLSSRVKQDRGEQTKTFPNGTYVCKPYYLLSIPLEDSVKLNELVSFTRLKDSKTKGKDGRGLSRNKPYSSVVSVLPLAPEPVYCCNIPTTNSFALSNGVQVGNCLEITLKHRASCCLHQINLGKLKPTELVKAFRDNAEWIMGYHKYSGADESGIYLPTAEDRQVGIGAIGLANFLAIQKVTYQHFVEALERTLAHFTGYVPLEPTEPPQGHTEATEEQRAKADYLANEFYHAYQEGAVVGRKQNFTKIYAVAPTASMSFRYRDTEGYTTSPEISPPVGLTVDRDSELFGVQVFEYHPDSETAEEVGWHTQARLLCAWQALQDSTGLAHAISANIWQEAQIDQDWLEWFIASPLKTTYYRLQTKFRSLDKSQVITEENIDKTAKELREPPAFPVINKPAFTVDTTPGVSCNLDDQYCESCGG